MLATGGGIFQTSDGVDEIIAVLLLAIGPEVPQRTSLPV